MPASDFRLIPSPDSGFAGLPPGEAADLPAGTTGGSTLKPCPQCGGPLHFVVNRWTHVTPGRCLLVTLFATPDEIALHRSAPRLTPARCRMPAGSSHDAGKFGYLAQGAEVSAD
jgi:hypothetical protein